jgi:Ribbon-helix-helix protein, copG family
MDGGKANNMDETLTQIAISLPNKLLTRVDSTSKQTGQSRSRIVRDLVEMALNQEPGEEYALFLKPITVPAANGRPTGEHLRLEASPNVNFIPQRLTLISDNLSGVDIMNTDRINITGHPFPIPAYIFDKEKPIYIPIKKELIVPGVPFTLIVANKTEKDINLWGLVIGRGFIKKPEYW